MLSTSIRNVAYSPGQFIGFCALEAEKTDVTISFCSLSNTSNGEILRQ